MILVFPGRQALVQYQRRLQQPAHWGALYTWAGSNSLLQALLRAIPPSSTQPLSEVGGMLATIKALAEEDSASPLYGIAGSKKLPHKLWRLVLQLKAAGLAADKLRATPVLRALGRLMGNYQKVLDQAGLEDEADALGRVLAYLADNGLPPRFSQYNTLQARDILWLRPLDMRLLLGLRGLIEIKLDFALPYIGSQGMLRLINETATVLEEHEGLEIVWPDNEEPDEDNFSQLVYRMMQGQNPGQGRVMLERPGGLYGEVEFLLKKAREQIELGVAPEDIVLVFPDLNLYGQMAEDVGRRLGVPLAFRRSQPLSHMPMSQALFALLNLTNNGWQAKEVKKVISNKYLFSFFNNFIKEIETSHNVTYSNILPDLLVLLDKAAYVDSVETGLPEQLRQHLNTSQKEDDYLDLAIFFDKLYAFINKLNNENGLSLYIDCILNNIHSAMLPVMSYYDITSTQAAGLLARDLQTWQQLKQSLLELADAGRQVAFDHNNVLEEYVAGQASREGQAQGVMVVRLEDAVGLKPRVLLAGGLLHRVLPGQPEPFILARRDRLLLNQMAGMPVWRGQMEEYYGQQLRLNLLLANATDIAVFTSPQADSGGQLLRPSIWFRRLARTVGVKDFARAAGVFGREPDLLQSYNLEDLRLALVYNLYGCGPHLALAQALLEQFPGIIDDFSPQQRPANNRFSDLSALQGRLARIRHLSASSLNEYIACPQRWFFAYMCGLKELPEVAHDLNIMDEGSLVHAMLAAFFAPENFNLPASTSDIREKLERIWDEIIPAQKQHNLILEGRRPLLVERLVRVIENDADVNPVAVESFFSFSASGLPKLLGHIDRVDLEENEVVVTDYKYSGNIRVKDFQPEDGRANNVQLLLYLAAISRQFPEKSLRARIAGCKDGNIYNVLHYPAHAPALTDNESGMLGQVREIWSNISQGHFAFTDNPDACARCAYNFICRVRERGQHAGTT